MSTYSAPTALTLRTFQSGRVYTTTNQQLTVPLGPIPAGALVVAVVFAGPLLADFNGNLNQIGIPRFFNGVNQGNMNMVQTAISGFGENVAQSQFAVAYRFVPNNGLGGDPNFAVQLDTSCNPGTHQVVDIQVAVYDGGDSTGTVVSAHDDGNDYFGSGPEPATAALVQSIGASVSGVMIGVWCSQDAGIYSASSYGAGAGPFGTLEQDNNIPFQLSGTSVVVDVPAGTTPAMFATQYSGFTPNPVAFQRIRTAVLVVPIKKIDAVGELATEGY